MRDTVNDIFKTFLLPIPIAGLYGNSDNLVVVRPNTDHNSIALLEWWQRKFGFFHLPTDVFDNSMKSKEIFLNTKSNETVAVTNENGDLFSFFVFSIISKIFSTTVRHARKIQSSCT